MKISQIILAVLGCLLILVVSLLSPRSDSVPEFPVKLTAAEVESYYENSRPEDYAYLDLDEASPEMKVVIVDARNRIANRYSYVADDIRGWITDENGITIEVLPKFHDLFPGDWDLPTDPQNRGIIG